MSTAWRGPRPELCLSEAHAHWRAVSSYEMATPHRRWSPSTATISVIHNKTFGVGLRRHAFVRLRIFKQETTNAACPPF